VVAAVAPAPASAAFFAGVRSTSPEPRLLGDRNWTFRGDTVTVFLRNSALGAGAEQRYTVCYPRAAGRACSTRSLHGPRRDVWRLGIGTESEIIGRYRLVGFTWRVGGRVVARRTIWVYE
jgi:hypothetical protein